MKCLIVYSGKYGSTRAAGLALSRCFENQGFTAITQAISRVSSLSGVDLLIIASPVYYGRCPDEVFWFLDQYAPRMKELQVLMFMTCLRLTRDVDVPGQDLNIHVDPGLAEPPTPIAHMGLMEKSHSLSHYLGPLEDRLHKAGIRTLAFFKGDLVFSRLEWKSRMVMRLMTWLMPQICQGSFLDTEAISRWVLSEIHHRK